METIRYTEKKKSAKGIVIFLFLFIVIGAAIIVWAIQNEEDPALIGSDGSTAHKLENLEVTQLQEEKERNQNLKYEVKDTETIDSSNEQISGEIVLPEIYVEGVALTEINEKIQKDYENTFGGLKTQMLNAENKFHYEVSYVYYENMVSTNKILSLVISQKITDLANNNVTMEKTNTYNVDLVDKKTLSSGEISKAMLGKDYKTIMRSNILSFVVENGYMNEEDFQYTVTGLENCYIKESQLYVVFNPDELVAKDKGIIQIPISE